MGADRDRSSITSVLEQDRPRGGVFRSRSITSDVAGGDRHVANLPDMPTAIGDPCVMHDDRERCQRAVRSRDARFDGWFFTAVLTTGIYCRPSCPARPPKATNMRFFASAASAQQAGFLACKRCRPDASPGSPRWNERTDLVARATQQIGRAGHRRTRRRRVVSGAGAILDAMLAGAHRAARPPR